jgi:cyclopropane fatty-acyl-phospholipid synthase-like methyltransferase
VSEKAKVPDHYSAQYGQFAAVGEDIGQNSWLTVEELERFAGWLELDQSSKLLDGGCGSGGPALHIARLTGCEIVGVELYA